MHFFYKGRCTRVDFLSGVSRFLMPIKSRPVCGSSQLVSDKIFCRGQRLCMFDPKTSADKKFRPSSFKEL